MYTERNKSIRAATAVGIPVLVFILIYLIAVVGLSKALSPMVSLFLPTALFIGTIAVVVFTAFPFAGLYFAIAAVPMEMLGQIGDSGFLSVSRLSVVLIALVYVVKSLLSQDTEIMSRSFRNPVVALGFLFVLFSWLSLINATDIGISIGQDIRRTLNFVFAVFLVQIIRTRDVRDKALLFHTIGLAIASFAGLYELITHVPFLPHFRHIESHAPGELGSDSFRVVGLTNSANFHAMMMGIGILSAMYLFLRTSSKTLRVVLVLLAPIFFLNILGSGTRSAVIMVIVGLAVFLYFADDLPRLKIAVVSILAATVMFVGFFVYDTTGSAERYTGDDTGTIYQRYQLIVIASRMISDHPILGVGSGNYYATFYDYADVNMRPFKAYVTHNSPLQAWAENGVFQFILFFVFYAAVFLRVYRSRSTAIDAQARYYHAFALSVMAALFVQSLIISVLENQTYWTMFAFVALATEVSGMSKAPEPLEIKSGRTRGS